MKIFYSNLFWLGVIGVHGSQVVIINKPEIVVTVDMEVDRLNINVLKGNAKTSWLCGS